MTVAFVCALTVWVTSPLKVAVTALFCVAWVVVGPGWTRTLVLVCCVLCDGTLNRLVLVARVMVLVVCWVSVLRVEVWLTAWVHPSVSGDSRMTCVWLLLVTGFTCDSGGWTRACRVIFGVLSLLSSEAMVLFALILWTVRVALKVGPG